MKISAEEIETGLIKPNSSLAQLHIALLKVLIQFLSYFLLAGCPVSIFLLSLLLLRCLLQRVASFFSFYVVTIRLHSFDTCIVIFLLLHIWACFFLMLL